MTESDWVDMYGMAFSTGVTTCSTDHVNEWVSGGCVFGGQAADANSNPCNECLVLDERIHRY